MSQEDKELLIKDLCARLPYGVKFAITNEKTETLKSIGIDKFDLIPINLFYKKPLFYLINEFGNIEYKPYLRPMSSMTEEEKGELKLEQEKDEELFIQVINKSQNGDDSLLGTVIPHCAEDWANKNHFDYRGLIEKGLALKAPEGMYNIKEL